MMSDNKNEKTNVMRLLEQKKISYRAYSYGDGASALSGSEVARELGLDPDMVFKTLVTLGGRSKRNFVFVVPVERELDLKKAALAVDEKSIEMIKSKDLLALTGYVHGGCSPIGMKKPFTTVFHISAKDRESIVFSAGKIGHQVELSPAELPKILALSYSDVCVDL